MKRVFSVFLAIVMLLGILPAAAFAEEAPVLSFATTAAENPKVGDEFTVTASLSANPGLASVVLSLAWNTTNVQFQGFETVYDEDEEEDVLKTEVLSNFTNVANHEKGVIASARTKDNKKIGTLFVAKFKVIAEGDFEISLKRSDTEYLMKNANGEVVTFTIDESAIANLSATPAAAADPNTITLTGNADIGSIVFSDVTVKESKVTEGTNELIIDVTLDEATAQDATVNIAVKTIAGLLVVAPEEAPGYSTFTNTYYTGPATLNGTAPLSGGKGGFLFKAAPMGADDFFYRINFTVYCDHVWTDATCVSPKTCSVCGATEGEKNPEAHKYVDGKCEYCGAASATTAGYTVAASEDVPITAGENAEVSITVTEADSKAYNAYQLNVTYPEGLTYVSASGSGVKDDNFQANHDETSRTIQIIGYGADKASGTAAAKLTFTGSTVGEYEVTISSAKVDAAASAPNQNTPDATIGDAATKITVTGYTVTLGEGLTADSFVAYPGNDYTFQATDADNYDYTVTAKIGETKITVNDNKDGTYTIPADQITGNINVSAVMNPKSYDVTYDGTTTENAATYNTPYVFTPEKEGYTVGGVTVTIGGEGYTGYSNVDGTYTIPGNDITGDISITVDWIKETPATVIVGKGDGVIGGDNATMGEDYTFSFGDTDEYDYDEETLVVMVGETDITEQVTKNEETGEYTIPGSLITGDITISIERTEKVTFTVEVSEYLTLNNGKMYLVTVKGVEDGKVAKYGGQNMFWSAQTLTTGENGEETIGYGAYAWLVISNEGLEAVKTAASENVTTAEGTTNLTVDYSGDVNGTEKVDVNDAQLVYNMYNAYYGDFTTVSMQKFLDADVNSDQTVNVTDAAAVVTAIINAK